jgi:ABC-type Co2+ transport system permease subunit
MLIFVAVIASLVVLGWLVYRVARGRPFKAHTLAYSVAIVAGVFTTAYFLSMDIPQLVKILVSILVGIVLIILGAYIQQKRQQQPDKS